jgi:hypothetical protein
MAAADSAIVRPAEAIRAPAADLNSPDLPSARLARRK